MYQGIRSKATIEMAGRNMDHELAIKGNRPFQIKEVGLGFEYGHLHLFRPEPNNNGITARNFVKGLRAAIFYFKLIFPKLIL